MLFSGDWQMQASNLDLVSRVADQALHVCLENRVKTFVHTGDLKHVLNPIDGRVLNCAIDIVKRFRDNGIQFLVNRGNHDKLSVGGTEDWFPSLQAAGALTFSVPDWVLLEGYRVCFLPYCAASEVSSGIRSLLAGDNPEPRLLIFHHSLSAARVNVSRTYEGDDGLPVSSLQPDRFQYCIGGHFHMQQNVSGNVWYAGSPFCQDWGEANQRKGFLLLKKGKLTAIPSEIPGWYDPELPDYEPPQSWAGRSVRVHVPVDKRADNVQVLLKAAQESMQDEFPGARIVAVEADETQPVTREEISGAAEDEALSQWIAAAAPEDMQDASESLRAFLAYYLRLNSGSRRSKEAVSLLKLEARNMLSFEKLDIDFQNPSGIRVIQGKNRDWAGRSNGAGKSSYLQMVAVGLFGKSLKGQTADALRRRGSSGECWLRLYLRLPDGRELIIQRGRKPKGTTVTLNGRELTGASESHTQREIELLTGFTFEVARAALFIDQRDVNAMLTATPGERKALLAQFLNLERFGRTQKAIKDLHAKCLQKAELLTSDLEGLQYSMEQAQRTLASVQEAAREREELLQRDLSRLQQDIAREEGAYRAAKGRLEALEAKLAERSRPDRELDRATESARVELRRIQDQIEQQERAATRKTCNLCGAPLDTSKAEALLKSAKGELAAARALYTQCLEKSTEAQAVVRELTADLRKIEAQCSANKAMLGSLRKQEAAVLAKVEQPQDAGLISKLKAEIRQTERVTKIFKTARKYLEEEQRFLRMAIAAVGPKGMPAFLMAAICPELNRAAARYSRLFSDSAISVRFSFADEEIDVAVDNASGGERLEDQSSGETRIASLIVAFALREIVTGIDILVADEPGEGLDEVNARRFASGLRSLIGGRFRSILVTTHNPILLSELSDFPQVVIEKEDGISRVL